MYPLLFTPVRREMLWGLEIWTVSGLAERGSVIENGPLAGRLLSEVIESDKTYYLGSGHHETAGLPLLVKIIDARGDLSVQVHPGTGQGAKDEAWYVLESPEGAELICGLKSGVTRREIERSIDRGCVIDCFDRINISPGQIIKIPAGRPHAITAGVKLLEIQQSSDTTYRIFDYNRPGADGKPRALHIPEALSALDYVGSGVIRSFSLDVCELDGVLGARTNDGFCLISCVGGCFEAEVNGVSVNLEKTRTALIPAGAERYTLSGKGVFIKSAAVIKENSN